VAISPSTHPGGPTYRAMSSGFVSAGSLDGPEESDEWKKVKKDLDEARKRKEEQDNQHGGKSAYEIIQANKGG
jgi:FAM192A/Fyv6, N-terminal domain